MLKQMCFDKYRVIGGNDTMNPNEIKSFEDLWKKLWEIIYAIINFFKGAGKDDVDIGSNTVKFDSVSNVY